MCQWDMPEAEYALLTPVADVRKVKCIPCGATLAKRNVWTHLAESHPELAQEAWDQWTIRGDYNLVKHGKAIDSFSAFNLAWARKSGLEVPDDDVDQEEGAYVARAGLPFVIANVRSCCH